MPEVAVAPGDAALGRVLSLPRREPASPELIDALSRHLRTRPDDVSCTLRPAQVEILRELFEYGGGFCPVQVGGGKSLPTFTAPTLLKSQRPVLVIPASLREKTKREFARYAKDWRVRLPTLVSYEELGKPGVIGKQRRQELGLPAGSTYETLLLDLNPDLLMLDEAHHVRNDSARRRRVARCVEQCRPRVLALSGTLMTENLLDYQHHAVWCLGAKAPLPTSEDDAKRWAAALDRDLGVLHRIAPGELASIPGGYHAWFRESRGVVPTSGCDCASSIQVSIWKPALPPRLAAVIDDVARSSLRPDDELLDELELPDCLAQLALGFYYRWDPMPPDWWLLPRRAWRRYVRDVLDAKLEGFDSEGQIVAALDRAGELASSITCGVMPPNATDGRERLATWRAVRDNFTPNPVPVWLDAGIMQAAAEHARTAGTLVWTRFRAAGHMLAQLGIPYYGGGTEPDSHARPGQPIALSIAAHGTGRNMQAWHRSLILTPPANADAWEQLIGRTHRAGQSMDTVLVECLGTIDYHGKVLAKVLAQARAITQASGFTHKLVLADWV